MNDVELMNRKVRYTAIESRKLPVTLVCAQTIPQVFPTGYSPQYPYDVGMVIHTVTLSIVDDEPSACRDMYGRKKEPKMINYRSPWKARLPL